MSSLRADFDELRERIRHGRELGDASFEPIFTRSDPGREAPNASLGGKAPSRGLGGSHVFDCGEPLGSPSERSILVALSHGGQGVASQLVADQ